jgi:hypothetical protein
VVFRNAAWAALGLLTALVGGSSACSAGTKAAPTADASASDANASASDASSGGPDSAAPDGNGGLDGPSSAPDGGASDTGTGHPDAALQTSNCFASPGACGFPDPAYGDVGPMSPCSSLTASGSITASTAGQTIQNLNITGSITVNAANVTITNVCVSSDGAGNINNGPAVRFNSTGGSIDHSTVRGANGTDQSVQAVLSGSGTASHVYLYNCSECVHDGPWTVSDSYIESNAASFEDGYVNDAGQGPADHHESFYFATSTLTVNHDTIFNPYGETAAVFGDTYNNGGVCGNHTTITNSLLAGGGYTIYTCSSQTSAGASTMNVSNNRFARCLTPAVFNKASGGNACAGGPDSHGYWPNGGYYGIDAYTNCPPMSGQTWSGNVWDDDGGTIACQ